VHADYAGPFLGRMFLILVDAYSKWVDVHMVHSSTSQLTIEKMRTSFATFNLPQTLVTDNGTQFTSAEFSVYNTEWNYARDVIPIPPFYQWVGRANHTDF